MTNQKRQLLNESSIQRNLSTHKIAEKPYIFMWRGHFERQYFYLDFFEQRL